MRERDVDDDAYDDDDLPNLRCPREDILLQDPGSSTFLPGELPSDPVSKNHSRERRIPVPEPE